MQMVLGWHQESMWMKQSDLLARSITVEKEQADESRQTA
jgi:hypothetical protein